MATRQKTPKQCFRDRSYDLTVAVAAASPQVIGRALVQGELISQDVVSNMGNQSQFDQASTILNAVSIHITVDPKNALGRFIKVLLDDRIQDNAVKKIVREMANESKSYKYDNRSTKVLMHRWWYM